MSGGRARVWFSDSPFHNWRNQAIKLIDLNERKGDVALASCDVTLMYLIPPIKNGGERDEGLMHQFHFHLSLSILNHVKLLCCTSGKIDNPLIRAMRASIIDLHDNALVVF